MLTDNDFEIEADTNYRYLAEITLRHILEYNERYKQAVRSLAGGKISDDLKPYFIYFRHEMYNEDVYKFIPYSVSMCIPYDYDQEDCENYRQRVYDLCKKYKITRIVFSNI